MSEPSDITRKRLLELIYAQGGPERFVVTELSTDISLDESDETMVMLALVSDKGRKLKFTAFLEDIEID